MADAKCPPHVWQLTRVERDGAMLDHHHCSRCGAEKDQPVGDSASMFADRRGRQVMVEEEEPLLEERV